MQTKKTRILLADDHSVVRRGFGLILSAQLDLEVIGEAVKRLPEEAKASYRGALQVKRRKRHD